MIAFHGDSYTWGSGLQYHCLVEEHGYNWIDCEKFLPGVCRLESFPKNIDDYRIKNGWPNIVSEYFNVHYFISLNGNGGDNDLITKRLTSPYNFYHIGEIDLHIIQLSAPLRGIKRYDTITSNISELIYHEFYEIYSNVVRTKNNFLFLSWFPEHSNIIKEICPNNLITINYGEYMHECFQYLTLKPELTFKGYNLNDYHFNKEGHKLIAESVINKIKQMNFKFDLLNI